MTDSTQLKPERRLQPSFSKIKFFSSLASGRSRSLPQRCGFNASPAAGRPRTVSVIGQAVPVAVGAGVRGWRLTAPDRRFGGLSALAVERGELVALTDSGVVVRFAPPGAGQALRVALHDLPGGPGSPLRKSSRDSESLLRDPGRARVVGRVRKSSFAVAASTIRSGECWRGVDWRSTGASIAAERRSWPPVAGPGPARKWRARRSAGRSPRRAGTADAARLPDGRLVLLVRRIGWRGFDNQLWIAAGSGRPARRIALDLGALDNIEGLAAESRPGGRDAAVDCRRRQFPSVDADPAGRAGPAARNLTRIRQQPALRVEHGLAQCR